ncbi:hypothetical protein FV219_00860 [Methylobacterium sp. WL122]|nr:hypothetical protein FV219_00860 [Methylobacterium sp. WL122]
MDAPAYHAAPPVQVLRDRRGVVIGRIEHQRLTGKAVARDSKGILVGTYDPREGATRDAAGRVVARGDVLAAFLIRP